MELSLECLKKATNYLNQYALSCFGTTLRNEDSIGYQLWRAELGASVLLSNCSFLPR